VYSCCCYPIQSSCKHLETSSPFPSPINWSCTQRPVHGHSTDYWSTRTERDIAGNLTDRWQTDTWCELQSRHLRPSRWRNSCRHILANTTMPLSLFISQVIWLRDRNVLFANNHLHLRHLWAWNCGPFSSFMRRAVLDNAVHSGRQIAQHPWEPESFTCRRDIPRLLSISFIWIYCDVTAERRNNETVVAMQRECKRVSIDTNSHEYKPVAMIRWHQDGLANWLSVVM
jgi:hypothetical protein